jgi:two-component system CheB/CheR fusion protein
MSDSTEPSALRVAVLGGHDPAAISQIVRGLPEHVGLAVVVSCSDGADLAARLRSVSALPVTDVRERERLERDRVFVVPNGYDVSVQDGDLIVGKAGTQVAPLDRLLRSIADTHGRDSAGVILGGPGSDGTIGIKRLKEAGGITIAQSPREDSEDDMPRTAIATGMIDLVLPLGEISGRLSKIGREPRELPLVIDLTESRTGTTDAAEDTLRDILSLVRLRSGHDFGLYKRATLFRRIARRMQVCQTETFADYHRYLREHPTEIGHLVRDFLISVTNFFRDPEAWQALVDQVIPSLFLNKSRNDQVRVWVAGCATGEEAYSVAMLLAEHASRLRDAPKVQVFATDIDEDSLVEARAGRYPETIAADVSPERLDRFFEREGLYYCVRHELRELVLFSPHNVLRDPPFSRLDLVTCRNLLIYLNREAQDRVLAVFHFALRAEGYLFLGSSEFAENSSLFGTLDSKARIFNRRLASSSLALEKLVSSGRHLPFPAPPLPSVKQTTSFGELHHRLVEHYAPPSVLVNEELDVLHVSEHAGRYLAIGGGEPSRQLLQLVHPALRLELRSAIYAARNGEADHEPHVARFQENGRQRSVTLRVRSVDLPELGRGTLLVLFDEDDVAMIRPGEPVILTPLAAPNGDASHLEPVVRGLETELHRTRDQLRTTIEQYETSLEELKASNEELQAINEELRSATEELETSKEELQSVNEELITLNHELKYKVDELSHANSDLQNLMTSTDIGVVFLDRQLNIKRFTPRVRDLINVIPSDIGRPLAHLTHKLDADELPELARQVLEDLRTIEREVQSREGRRYLVRLLPYRSLEDRIDGVVVTFVEVSDLREAIEARQRSEEARQAVEELLRIALRDAPMVLLSLDERGDTTTGYVLGKELSDDVTRSLQMFAPGHADRFTDITREVMRTRTGQRVELDLVIDAEHRTYDFHVEPISNGGVIAAGFDITPSKLAEATLRDTDRRKDEFLATLSHELRNPLTPLKVALDVARIATEPKQLTRSLGIMERQVAQLTQLVDELLDLSRITQGKITLDRVPLEPAVLVEAALEATRPVVLQHGHQMTVKLPEQPCRVIGDFSRLTQVLTNLISNAAKYTPDGGRIDLELEGDLEAEVLVIKVRDNGVGISPAMMPTIFDIFVQCRDELGRSQGGLGIGLNLVRRLVELHGGRVTASSAGANRGSEFVVELPIMPR